MHWGWGDRGGRGRLGWGRRSNSWWLPANHLHSPQAKPSLLNNRRLKQHLGSPCLMSRGWWWGRGKRVSGCWKSFCLRIRVGDRRMGDHWLTRGGTPYLRTDHDLPGSFEVRWQRYLCHLSSNNLSQPNMHFFNILFTRRCGISGRRWTHSLTELTHGTLLFNVINEDSFCPSLFMIKKKESRQFIDLTHHMNVC